MIGVKVKVEDKNCKIRATDQFDCRGHFHYEKRKNYVISKQCDCTFSCIHYKADGSEKYAEDCMKEGFHDKFFPKEL